MDIKLLKEIKETEQKAQQIIEQALKKRGELLEAAAQQAIRAYQAFLDETEEAKEAMIAEHKAEIKRHKKSIIARHEKDVEKLKASTAPLANEAVSSIVTLFRKAV